LRFVIRPVFDGMRFDPAGERAATGCALDHLSA
jgi:hypothetical protein